mmetsp:Transcript_1521/g.3963  ORF Transcript_1521/g.3963 Transcript_1521/m.3963 type:complete len:258 (+) Transcript_1521:501-1274(+)
MLWKPGSISALTSIFAGSIFSPLNFSSEARLKASPPASVTVAVVQGLSPCLSCVSVVITNVSVRGPSSASAHSTSTSTTTKRPSPTSMASLRCSASFAEYACRCFFSSSIRRSFVRRSRSTASASARAAASCSAFKRRSSSSRNARSRAAASSASRLRNPSSAKAFAARSASSSANRACSFLRCKSASPLTLARSRDRASFSSFAAASALALSRCSCSSNASACSAFHLRKSSSDKRNAISASVAMSAMLANCPARD